MRVSELQAPAALRTVAGPIRSSSPVRREGASNSNTPLRHRPASPLKLETDDRSARLLNLARKERALFELKERRRELEAQIRHAEMDLDSAKRQLAIGCSTPNSPLKPLSSNVVRQTSQRDKEMEALQHIAEGMSAIWKDVVQATIGEQPKT